MSDYMEAIDNIETVVCYIRHIARDEESRKHFVELLEYTKDIIKGCRSEACRRCSEEKNKGEGCDECIWGV